MTIIVQELYKDLSEIELIQLSDINGTGELNTDVLDDAISDALAFIESFFSLPETPTPLLQKIGVDLAIYELRRKNNLIDDVLKEERKESEGYLLKMAKGLIPKATSAGVTPSPQKVGSFFAHTKSHMNTSGLEMP